MRWLNTKIRGDVRGLQRGRARNHFVYLIGPRSDDDARPVKVGFSSDVDTRLRQLQTASPELLEVLALVPGTQALEANIHRRLAPCRVRGEWYRLHDDDIACLLADLYEDFAFGDFRDEAA